MMDLHDWLRFGVRAAVLMLAAFAIMRHPRLDKHDRAVAVSALCVVAIS